MTAINLAAIRKRDAEMEYWQVTGGSAVCTDRRVLLGCEHRRRAARGGAMSEAKRYNLRPMIDGDNVMDWPRDLRRGPYVVIATDYDDLLARCEAAEARLAETEWSCAGKGPDSSLPSTPSPDEYESVGWQYKFPGISGGGEWRDSPHNYNGSRYTESREIIERLRAHVEHHTRHRDPRECEEIEAERDALRDWQRRAVRSMRWHRHCQSCRELIAEVDGGA